MSMKTKGITIELSADTTGLEKALKDINKSLSQTQKDLNAVNKALKMDPKNTELMEQKQRLLAKAIDETKRKVDALKTAQSQLADKGTEEAQRQYDALTREISEAEVKLKSLNQEQKQFNAESQQAQTSASGFGKALEVVGNKAEDVARKTAAMSAAAATALSGMAGLVVNAAEFADKLLETSRETGLSTDALQKMQYAAEMVDVPMETIVSSIRKMKSHLDDSEDVWRRLGVNVKNQHNEYRDIESIFFDVIRALGQIENETERDTVAMELFGRSADDLAGIIDDGGKALKSLGNEAENLGLIVSEEDIERLGEFDDALKSMQAQLKAAAVAAALPILEAMQPVIERVSEAVKKFAEILSHMNPKLIAIVVIILAIIAAIAPVALLIANISRGILALINLIPLLVTGIQMIGVALTTLAANPVVLTIAGIVVALAALAAAIIYVVNNWDTIGPAVDNAVEAMQAGISNVLTSASELGSKIRENLSGALNSAGNAFSGMGAALQQEFSGVPDLIERVSDAFYRLVNDTQQIISSISSIFDKIKNEAREAGQNIINAFVGGVKSVINSVTQAFQNLADSIRGIWSATENDARSSGSRAAMNYANGYNSSRGTFTASVRTASSSYVSANAFYVRSAQQNSMILSALNTLNDTISKQDMKSQVNVELVGSAKNIFDTVRVQNARLTTATGYHALA